MCIASTFLCLIETKSALLISTSYYSPSGRSACSIIFSTPMIASLLFCIIRHIFPRQELQIRLCRRCPLLSTTGSFIPPLRDAVPVPRLHSGNTTNATRSQWSVILVVSPLNDVVLKYKSVHAASSTLVFSSAWSSIVTPCTLTFWSTCTGEVRAQY